jgi:hypothetical protein
VPHDEMPGIWSSHDVFVQVSDFEGTSVSMLEAMAHGVVPVVTAASSGIADVIHHEENGFVAPVGDMKALAEHIRRLADDRALLSSAGGAAYESAKAYSMTPYTERFTQVLDQAVATGPEQEQKRSCTFVALHPLYKQRQVIVEQQEQIRKLKRGPMQRLSGRPYGARLPVGLRRLLGMRSA